MKARRVWAGAAVVAAALVLLVPSSASALTGGSARTVTGSLERVHLDLMGNATAPADDDVALIRNGGTAVRVPSSDVAQVPTGATISAVVGGRVDSASALSTESGASVTSLAVLSTPRSAVAPAASIHDVTVVLATWPGQAPDSTTASGLSATINGAVNDYWSTVTNHRIGFKVSSAHDWITVPTAACVNGDPASGTFGFWKDVETAVGFVEGPARHLVVHIPANSPCGGSAGIGTVGSSPASGGLLWVRGATADVVGHELGHNLSLGHSSTLTCSVGAVTVADAPASNCTKNAYRDLGDIMGMSWNHLGFLNAAHLARLGMLDSVADVSTPRSVTLTPASGSGALRSIRIRDSIGAYYVELRAATGLDSWLGTTPGWVDAGVTVRRDFTSTSLSAADQARLPARESFLLDGDVSTPDTSFGSARTTLPLGQWVDFAGKAFGLRVISLGGVGAAAFAKVEVRINGVAPTPVVTTPAGQWSGGVTGGSVTSLAGRLQLPVRLTFTPNVSASSTSRMAAPVAVSSSATRVAASTSWVATSVTAGRSSTSVYARVISASAMTTTKAWKVQLGKSSLGLRAVAAHSPGASATYSFVGQAIAVLANSAPRNGGLRIVIDGHHVGVSSLASARPHLAVVAFTVSNLAPGHHSLTLVTTSGAPVSLVGIAQVQVGMRPAG